MKILRYSDAVYVPSTQNVASFARIRVMSNFNNFKNVSAMIFNLQFNSPVTNFAGTGEHHLEIYGYEKIRNVM